MALYDEILLRMTQDYTARTGVTPDDASDIGIRFKTLAAQLALLSAEVTALDSQTFPATATGDYLDLHAAARGLARKAGICAGGALTFSRENAAAHDILIPAGTLCQTAGENGVRFQTLSDATLSAGSLSVDAAAAAQLSGSAGNVLAGTVSVLVTPPGGITAVTNRAAFSGGIDAESDDALRLRLSETFSRVANGCNAGFYLDLALGYPGVASAVVLAQERGANTVDVVIYGAGEAPAAAVIAGLQADIDSRRTLGVDVLVRTATAVPTSLTLAVSPAAGWSAATAQADAEAAARAHLAALAVGAPLLTSPLLSAVVGCESVGNCHLTAPAADTYALSDSILTAGTVTVGALEVS